MGDRAERLVNLTIAFLEARAPMTFEDVKRKTRFYLQDDHESARRMFERDKDALRSLGIPLQTVPASGGGADQGYLLNRSDYELDAIDLTVDEMSALAVALSAVSDHAASRAFAKVRAVAPDPGHGGASPAIAPALPDNADVVSAAIASRQVIRFPYQGTNGERSNRTIDPWVLVYRRGRVYIIGRDHDRDDQRVFRLDRIPGSVKALDGDGAFEPPDNVDVVAATDVPSEDLRATIEVQHRHRWLVEREGGVATSDGDPMTHEIVASRQNLVQLACELGERGRFVDPPDLVDDVTAALERLRDRHAEGAS